MGNTMPPLAPLGEQEDDEELDLLAVLAEMRRKVLWLVAGPLLAGLLALGVTYLTPPTFTAATTILPPQQQQSAAASALASLGALPGLAGMGGAIKTPGDQYAALIQSVTVTDRLVDAFKLMDVYGAKFRVDARRQLAANVRITVGKKDGLITIEVDDLDPQRAAALANAHVEQLRQMMSGLAVTEAQQRRVFFDQQLKQTRDKLIAAQEALESTGFSVGALRAEPRAAVEGYAKLRADVTAAEVKLKTLQRSLAETTPEVQQQETLLLALRGQLAKLEANISTPGNDYIGKYREYKYQETLYDLFARQYEMARLDESREGALIQVVDPATPPERKSRPKRAMTALTTTVATFVAIAAFLVLRLAVVRARSRRGQPARPADARLG
jgi:uncharacterized protein involved in exopolysaccharide biosynthesis